MALAQARQIDAVLVTELSRWGRSTTDLLATLKELEARRVSVVALNGMTFDLATPHGRMLATMLAGIAEFERELIQERIRSGIAAAKARGKRLGRQPGQRPKSDRLAPQALALVAKGRSYRLIGREVGLSKNTEKESEKRSKCPAPSSIAPIGIARSPRIDRQYRRAWPQLGPDTLSGQARAPLLPGLCDSSGAAPRPPPGTRPQCGRPVAGPARLCCEKVTATGGFLSGHPPSRARGRQTWPPC